jgi:glycosyltransferase involved in cell wall biosynthesis
MRAMIPCTRLYPEKIGGMEVFNSRLIQWMSEREDVTPLVVTTSSRFRVAGAKVVHLRRFSRFGRVAWIFGLMVTMARYGWKTDAVLFSYTRAPAAQWRVLHCLCRAFRLPYVVYVHGGGPESLEIARSCCRFFARAAEVYCVSDDLAARYSAAVGRACRAIPPVMPFEMSEFSLAEAKASLGLPAVSIVCLCVGSLKPIKGQDVLLDAFRLLMDEPEGVRLHLVMAGGGNWPALTERLRVDSRRVRLLGPISPLELRHVYRAADIYVQPSRVEGMPIALLEAASNGLPIVISDLPSMRSSWRDGVDCRKVRPGDTEALAEALKSLVVDPAGRAKYGAESLRNGLVDGGGYVAFDELLRALRRAAKVSEKAQTSCV